jgi:FixJ family two-component response regulator
VVAKNRPPEMIKIITYVLDDDLEELELLEPFLNRVCDCDFQLYTDVNDFIHAIEQGCHIAIIDFYLNTKVDGIEVGRMVLEKNPLCYLILFSGYDDKKTLIKAMNTGFKYFVDKNHPNAYQQVADVVAVQIPGIKMRIEIFNKYFKHITQHENAL